MRENQGRRPRPDASAGEHLREREGRRCGRGAGVAGPLEEQQRLGPEEMNDFCQR